MPSTQRATAVPAPEGPSFERARLTRSRALAVHTIAGPDHTFTPRWSHPMLLDAIVRAVS